MKHISFILVLLVLAFTRLACTAQVPITTPTLSPPPGPEIDIEATITAVVATALPAPVETPNIDATITAVVAAALPAPVETPDIDATVEARVQATIEAMPTGTPTSTLAQSIVSPTPTKIPPPVATLAPTPIPVETRHVEEAVNLNPYQVIQNSVVKIVLNTRGGD